jgi:aspartyl-tRNA(Asn)/glutamyl-tRNA(Gln) amidotransferase subunit A
MDIIAGPDPLDPTTLGAPFWNAKRTRTSPKGLKIGVPTRFYVDDLEPDIAIALDATIAMLRKLGAKISQVELPDQTVVSAAALIVLAVEATSAHASWLSTRASDYGPQVHNRLQNGLAYSAVEYLKALRWRGPALAAHLDAIGDVDVVIAPASRSVAPTIVATDLGGVPEAEAAIQAITRFMRPVNFLGLPSLVVPAGQSQSGLPIGIQLIGRPFGDEMLIALGRAFQAATDHHRRIPALP